MNQTNFRKDNHYVPRLYLKQWESAEARIWTYRVLVSHHNVPLWKRSSSKGIAHHEHLYTALVGGEESDEIEQWLNDEFESPAIEALHKAINNKRMAASDWKLLVRFLAAQDVRTPARLVESLQYWNQHLQQLIQGVLEETVKKLKNGKPDQGSAGSVAQEVAKYIPLKVSTEFEEGQDQGVLKAETVTGRSIWLFGIRRSLTHTLDVLLDHRWTILTPPAGMTWPTTDKPVVRLNARSPNDYDFDGGWGSKGTEILLPLSPQHLLYTQIGDKPPVRGSKMPREQAEFVRRFIVENAHRYIFNVEPEPIIENLRPRVVSKEIFEQERVEWHKWHAEQAAAELALKV